MTGIMMAQAATTVQEVFLFTRTLYVDLQCFNLYNELVASGYDGKSKVAAKVIIEPNVVVYSNSSTVPAFIDGFPVNKRELLRSFELTLNSSFIIGMGGAGNGGNGGTALKTEVPLTINSAGTIAGGGGGGAVESGGGGRSGRVNSPGGSMGGGEGSYYYPGSGSYFSVYISADWGDMTVLGGDGGDWGQRGGTGYIYYPYGYSNSGPTGPGGLGGKAVEGNSFITWLNNGTIHGAIT